MNQVVTFAFGLAVGLLINQGVSRDQLWVALIAVLLAAVLFVLTRRLERP